MGTKEAEAEAAAAVAVAVASNQSKKSLRSFTNPTSFWLLSTLSDLDERMKMVALNVPEKDDNDTFAQRAEAYYEKRPQLVTLLQDLYNAYLSLADRYHQTLTKHNHDHHRRQHSSHEHYNYRDEDEENDIGSDAESSLSYQQPPPVLFADTQCDAVVVELVMKSIECDILVDEMGAVAEQRYWSESWRKIELQKSLLEVLESERLILLDENARLGYKVAALLEENKGLASESMFMKRKAGELAHCVLRMREDHGVCMLGRKIEDLQRQIYGLEKKNKEYHEQLLLKSDQHNRPAEKNKYYHCNFKKTKSRKMMLEDCFQVDQEADANVTMKRGGEQPNGGGGGYGKRVSKWWDRVKNYDVFLCVPQPNFTCC
ncbi:kinase-interacting family protein [Cornus florida]|uniref:kinase-interacting family protein n=1 Tax=Cornus florida TaxID=4283 RepID=UPI00289CF070|nr:kinase-interacting family protein [Cornus florida]